MKERGDDRVPSAKGFDIEGLEENAMCATMFKMRAILGRFPCFAGKQNCNPLKPIEAEASSTGIFGGLEMARVLRPMAQWRHGTSTRGH